MNIKYFMPEYIIVICNFLYTRKNRDFPNKLRMYLMGITHQDTRSETEKTKGLPEKINSKYKDDIIYPEYFSLIKRPEIYGEKTLGKKVLSMRAKGAIAVYRMLGIHPEDIKNLVKDIYKEIYHWMDGRYKSRYKISYPPDDIIIILGERIDTKEEQNK